MHAENRGFRRRRSSVYAVETSAIRLERRGRRVAGELLGLQHGAGRLRQG